MYEAHSRTSGTDSSTFNDLVPFQALLRPSRIEKTYPGLSRTYKNPEW